MAQTATGTAGDRAPSPPRRGTSNGSILSYHCDCLIAFVSDQGRENAMPASLTILLRLFAKREDRFLLIGYSFLGRL